jgi:hypothetical protein
MGETSRLGPGRSSQAGPLDDVYPVVFLDCLVLKIRDGGRVQREACYLAMAINIDGDQVALGMWFQESERAKFWMAVLSELRHCGVQGMCRRLGGAPRGDRGDLPANHAADVHPAVDQSVAALRPAPQLRRRGPRPQADLHRDRCRARRPGGSTPSRRNGESCCHRSSKPGGRHRST